MVLELCFLLFSLIYCILDVDTYLSFQFCIACHMVLKREAVSQAVY